jgi:tight adherence protein B
VRAAWRREEPLPPDAVASAIRALAGSIRAGTPPAAALIAWKAVASEAVAEHVAAIGRRVALGESPATAVATLDPALARCFALQRAAGGSLPALLERVADGIERDAAVAGSARAATSGARLSARLVAGLPLAFAPLTSGGTPFRSGLAGFVLVAAGIALAVAGLWWIGRLVPVPPGSDDGAAALADDLAAALGGGIGLLPALEAAAEHPPAGLEDELCRASRRVRLGDHWVAALGREGGALAGVADVIARSRSWGVPAAGPLREWAAARRAEVRTETQSALRRAPVLMVVPLTVCVLPSFALLAFGPFVLGAFAAR